MIATLAALALLASAAGCVVFVALYHVLTGGHWRHTPLGQNVMAFMAAAAVLLCVAIARAFLPWLDQHIDLIRLISFSMVAGIVWWRVVILIRAQRTGRNFGMYGETVGNVHTDERTPR
jgi:hypothetical protein